MSKPKYNQTTLFIERNKDALRAAVIDTITNLTKRNAMFTRDGDSLDSARKITFAEHVWYFESAKSFDLDKFRGMKIDAVCGFDLLSKMQYQELRAIIKASHE